MHLPRLRWWYPLPLAVFLRLYDLGGQSYWTDEAITLKVAGWPLSQWIAYFKVDPHPPLYYLLAKLWLMIGSDSECWMRLLSALPAIGTVIVLSWALKRLTDEQTAFIGGLLLAINPLHIWASQDLRGLALCGFWLALAFAGLTRIQTTKQHRGRGLAIAGLVLAFYTHYFSLFIIPMLLFYKDSRKAVIPAVLAFLPWLFFLVQQIGPATSFRTTYASETDLFTAIIWANAGHFPWLLPSWGSDLLFSLMSHGTFLYFFFASFLVLPVIVLALISGKRNAFVLSWYFLPVFLALFGSFYIDVFSTKYTAIYVPFLMLAAAIGLAHIFSRNHFIAGILLFAVILVPGISLLDYYGNPLYRKTPWRECLPELVSELGLNDPILFYSATEAADVRFYLPDDVRTIDIADDFQQAQSMTMEQVRSKIPTDTERIALIDLNSFSYSDVSGHIREILYETRGEPTVDVLQPAMNVSWKIWGPPLKASSAP